MSLKFFWRCETETLDGTADFSSGDTTATANGLVSLDAAAGIVGTLGILCAANQHYRFDTASIANRLVGAMAGWVRLTSNPSGVASLFMVRGTSASDFYYIGTGGNWTTDTGEMRLVSSSTDTGGASTAIVTSGAALSLNTTYFIVAKWDQANSLRRIEIYNSDGSLRSSAENTSAYVAPLDLTLSTGIRLGESSGTTGGYHVDNIFIGDAYSDGDIFVTNRNITSYASYSGGSSATVTPAQAALTLNGRSPTTSAFQNVRIREVLVNASGQAVGSATDIGLRVWYGGICIGAPDVSLNGMTTDADGTTSWSIATGTLGFNDPIFYVAQNSLSYSHYTCGRLVPNYE